MHRIYFYRDNSGRVPVLEYIRELAAKKDKDSRINLHKVQDYINEISQYGVAMGEPYI